jgi:phage recombination protein Bet
MIEKNKSIERVPGTMEVWSDLALVRAQFAPTLTETEFKFFVTLGQSLGANPFKREIWSVKYDRNQPASIFLGRDMYRRKSQEQKEYDGHVPQAIYENDEFEVFNGIPEHSYGANGRGKLLGAYCMCWKKTTTHPYFVMVKIDEYNKNFANWKTMPETMIKKVAEAQCLRGAFQGVFAGTYDESEEAAIAAQFQPSAKGMIPPPPLKKQAEQKFEEAVTVTATEEPERTDDPGPAEPPMGNPATESEPPAGAGAELDIFAELDSKIDAYCKGDKANKTEVYKTLTAFTGSDKVVRSAWSIEQLKGWKNSEKIAKATMHKFDERVQMGTKFRFEQ